MSKPDSKIEEVTDGPIAFAWRAGWNAAREAAVDIAAHDMLTEPDSAGRQFVIRHGDPMIAAAIRAMEPPE